MGMPGMLPTRQSVYGGSVVGVDHDPAYQRQSFLGAGSRPESHFDYDTRASNYSLSGPAYGRPGMPVPQDSQFSFASYQPQPEPYQRLEDHPVQASRSNPSSFLPDLDTAGSGQLHAGAEAISMESLEASVRRICSGADLETMTKRNVRRQLEEQYGVDLKSRKDEIGRIIEDVLEGESCLISRKETADEAEGA